jgi:uncharacterized protein YggE
VRQIKKIIILTLIILLNLIITPSLEAETDFKNISTIGSAEITLRPDQAIIRLEINGEGSNKSRLNHQFREEIKKLTSKLQELFSNNIEIIQGEIEIVSYLDKANHFSKEIYRGTTYLKIKLDNNLIDNLNKLVDNIQDLNPVNSRVTYNQPDDFSYKIDRAYYTFKDPLKYQNQLLQEALNNSTAKLNVLLKLSSFKLVGIYQLKELQPSNISTYQEEINLERIKEATEESFKTELRVIYQVN